jgi:hypothetical protein
LHGKLLRDDAGDDHNTLQQQLVRCFFFLFQPHFHHVSRANERKHQENEERYARLTHVAVNALL